eukprot:scaffold25410_cov64-Phaeocystis_antarctica.AAC.3
MPAEARGSSQSHRGVQLRRTCPLDSLSRFVAGEAVGELVLVEHGVAQSLVDLAGDAAVTAPPLPAAPPRHALSPCSQRAWLVGREHPTVRGRLEISVGTHVRSNRHDGAGRCT